MIIEIENLKKYFKEVKAVDGISFNVREGELFAFLGVNGAGKSTTINIISGILASTAVPSKSAVTISKRTQTE